MERHVYQCTVVSVSYHFKNQTQQIGLEQEDIIIISLNVTCSCWKFAHLQTVISICVPLSIFMPKLNTGKLLGCFNSIRIKRRKVYQVSQLTIIFTSDPQQCYWWKMYPKSSSILGTEISFFWLDLNRVSAIFGLECQASTPSCLFGAFNRSRLPSKINGYLMVHHRLLFWQKKCRNAIRPSKQLAVEFLHLSLLQSACT